MRRSDRKRLSILYEDSELLVIDKPAGLLTIPSDPARAGFEDTVLKRVREYVARPPVRRSLGGGGRGPRPYVGVLHRLDRDTSGALAIALTHAAHAAGRDLFAAHHFERHYLAIVHGVPELRDGTIRAPISSRYLSGRRGVARPGDEARDAITHYRVLEAFRGASLVELELDTGRQHQIRAHLEHLGHPIVGEQVYSADSAKATAGKGRKLKAPRQMLHAWTLAFPHPLRGTQVSVEADPPRDFLDTLERLRK
jgi:23S rRNA pseudouridine1911/1915/1917 synthase